MLFVLLSLVVVVVDLCVDFGSGVALVVDCFWFCAASLWFAWFRTGYRFVLPIFVSTAMFCSASFCIVLFWRCARYIYIYILYLDPAEGMTFDTVITMRGVRYPDLFLICSCSHVLSHPFFLFLFSDQLIDQLILLPATAAAKTKTRKLKKKCRKTGTYRGATAAGPRLETSSEDSGSWASSALGPRRRCSTRPWPSRGSCGNRGTVSARGNSDGEFW